MKKFLLFVRLMLCLLSPSFSQTPLIKEWDYRFGGNAEDRLKTFQQTKDGGYILGGYSHSDKNGDKTQLSQGGYDFWVVKIDKNGIKNWDKRFGGLLDDELHALQQTDDGGYILGGFSHSGISGDKTQANWDTSTTSPMADYWIVKIDSLGNKEWDKRFGGIYEDELYSLQQTSDHGYILGGYSQSGLGGDKSQPSWGSTDYWIVKIDSYGNKLWDKRFGGVNNDQLYSLQQTTDGGYILGGYSWSQVSGDKTQPNCGTLNFCDYWVVKTDALGNKQWDKRFGGSDNDELYSLKQTDDGGFILGGYSWSGISGEKTQNNFGPAYTSDNWIVKIDGAGNLQWDKSFGGNEREDEFGNITQTPDRGFLLACSSYSDTSGNKTENNMGPEQSWIIKTDMDGNKTWDKTIFTHGHDESGLALQTKDGGYAVVNYSNGGSGGYKTQLNRDSSNATNDYWIVKFRDTTLIPEVNYNSFDQVVCANSCISFTNLTLYADTYHWIFNGANPSSSTDENPQNICYNLPGSYNVTLIASNASGSNTLTMLNYVTVNPLPLPFSIVQVGDTLIAPTGYASYQWSFNNIPITNANTNMYVALYNGTYSVFVTDNNGCGMISRIVNVQTGIIEKKILGSVLLVFPNPAANKFNLMFVVSKPVTVYLELFNHVGESVLSKEIKTTIGENNIEVSNLDLAPGIYSIKISGGDRILTRSLVIEK